MTTIKQRRGTAAQWTSANPVLAAGEPGFETDTGNHKIGDGATAWNSLKATNSATYVSKGAQRVYLADYVSGNGTDETSGFENARALAASTGRPLVGVPGITVKVAEIVALWNGARFFAEGMTLDIQTDHSAAGRYLGLDNLEDVAVRGLRLKQTNASGRNGVQGMVTILSGGDILLEDLLIDGGESCGIFTAAHSASTAAGVSDLRIVRAKVKNTYADGIHISRGASDIWVIEPHVTAVADDAIAINSVQTDDGVHNYNQITRVHVVTPVVNSTSAGSGVGFYGCKDSELTGGIVDTVPGQGLYCQQNSGGNGLSTHVPIDCNIANFRVRAATGVGYLFGVCTDIAVSNPDISGCTSSGIQLLAATRVHIVGGKSHGSTADVGVFDNGAGAGNNLIGVDLRGNSGGASAGSATLTSCVTV